MTAGERGLLTEHATMIAGVDEAAYLVSVARRD